MHKISTRQIYFFLAAIAPVGKIMLMPTQLAFFSKNDLLFPAVMNYFLQAGAVFLALLFASKNRTFYDALADTVGKAAAKIIVCLLALFFLYASILPLLEQKLYVQKTLYDTLPSPVTFFPFFLLSAYLCAKPIASLGRLWDILLPVSVVGYAGIMALSVSNADFGALMPVGISGAEGIFGGFAYSLSWFFDSALILALAGKFEYRKGMAWKGMLFYLAGGTAIVFFLAVFYGVYSDIALQQTFAFSEISKYFSGITVLGRIDYFFSFALVFVILFYGSLPLHAGVECVCNAFGDKRCLRIVLSVAVNVGLLVCVYLLNFKLYVTLQTVTKMLFWIFPVFCVLLPALCLLLKRRKHETAA